MGPRYASFLNLLTRKPAIEPQLYCQENGWGVNSNIRSSKRAEFERGRVAIRRFWKHLLWLCPAVLAGQPLTQLDTGASVYLDPSTGDYQIVQGSFGWRLAGNLNSEVRSGQHRYGGDSLGLYDEYSFEYRAGSRRGFIRIYYQQPVILFADEYLTPAIQTVGGGLLG